MKLTDNNRLWVPSADNFFKFSYEKMVTAKVMKNCPKDGVFLDIGAHVGLWSMRMSSLFAHGYAIEAASEHYGCLEKNLDHYGIDNVTSIHAGASDVTGETLRLSLSNSNSGRSSFDAPLRTKRFEDVPLIRLDDIQYVDKISFMKIDVEGHEVKTLTGALDVIERDRPDIFIEVNKSEHGKSENGLTLLKDLGYSEHYRSGSCNYYMKWNEK